MELKKMEVEIILTKKANQKLSYYIDECPVEISGFGKVRELPEGEGAKKFEVYDVEILPQTATGGDVKVTEEELAAFLTAKMRKRESVVDYKCWWHSHADFGVFFSGTDEETIEGSTDFPYLVSIVGNKRGEFLGRLDMYQPLRMTFDAIVLVKQDENPRLRRQVQKEIEEKVIINNAVMSDIVDDDEHLPKSGSPRERKFMTQLDRFLESIGYHTESDDDEDEYDDDNIRRPKVTGKRKPWESRP